MYEIIGKINYDFIMHEIFTNFINDEKLLFFKTIYHIYYVIPNILKDFLRTLCFIQRYNRWISLTNITIVLRKLFFKYPDKIYFSRTVIFLKT